MGLPVTTPAERGARVLGLSLGFPGSPLPQKGNSLLAQRRFGFPAGSRALLCPERRTRAQGGGKSRARMFASGLLSCPAAVPRVTCCPLALEQKGSSGGRETSPEIFEKFNLGRPAGGAEPGMPSWTGPPLPPPWGQRALAGRPSNPASPPSRPPQPPAKVGDGKCSLTAFPGLSEDLPPALPVAASSFARSGLKKAALCKYPCARPPPTV